MPRLKTKKKARTTVSLDPDLLAWARQHTGPGRRFYSLTHAVEMGLRHLQEHGT